MSIQFGLNSSEVSELAEWSKTHECSVQYVGAAAGQYTYSFTPTNLGTVLKVECACGKVLDLTDYNW